MATYDETLSETIGVAPAAPVACAVTLSEGAGLADPEDTEFVVAYYNVTPSDVLRVGVDMDVVRAQLASVSLTLGLAEALVVAPGVILSETLGIAPAIIGNEIGNVSLSDGVALAYALLPGLPVTLSETIGIALTQQAQQAITVLETLGIAETMVPAAIYQLSASETLELSTSLANFFGGEISETIGLAPVTTGMLSSSQTISEGLGIAEAMTPTLALRVTISEGIGLEASDALNMIYSGEIAEGIEIAAAYLAPGGTSVTTWAINARTKAVSEYTNYNFNSFAKVGDRYIAASSAGLYELTGETDDGTDIIADIKSGFAQFAGTRHTLFKAIYLGMRGEGSFVLKLVTGEGQTYTYSVTASDMRSTKVHMGKGLRARYFAFELISTGQDFDLDSIEFVPLVAQRRV